jgi:hypothetical protein
MGIEPTSEAWEASILPLYDARSSPEPANYTQGSASRTDVRAFRIVETSFLSADF